MEPSSSVKATARKYHWSVTQSAQGHEVSTAGLRVFCVEGVFGWNTLEWPYFPYETTIR